MIISNRPPITKIRTPNITLPATTSRSEMIGNIQVKMENVKDTMGNILIGLNQLMHILYP